MNKSTSNIGQFLQEDNGHFSAMRLAFLSWVFVALMMWSIDCWQHDRKLQEIPPSVAAMIAALTTGKVVQKSQEKRGNTAGNVSSEDDRARKGSEPTSISTALNQGQS